MIPFNRPLYFLLFFICHELLVAAYYFEFYMGLMPCPLCMVSRLWVYLLGGIFLLAALHNPRGGIQKIYHSLLSLIAVAGIATSAHHIYLQSLPADEVPSCGPGLDYMLDSLPFTEVLSKLIEGSGECAEVSWHFLGLTMPGWMLVFYSLTFIICLVPLFTKDRQYQFKGD